MKKLLFPLFLFITLFNVKAQIPEDFLYSNFDDIPFSNFDIASYENGVYKFCGEKKVYTPNNEFIIKEKMDANIEIKDETSVIKLNHIQYNSNGDSTISKNIYYSSHDFFPFVDFNYYKADSSYGFIQDSTGNWFVYFKSKSLYEENLLKKIITYIDWDFAISGSPSGLMKNKEINYVYDDTKLKYSTSKARNFITGDYEKSDSIHYFYKDNKIKNIISYRHQENGYIPFSKYVYNYNDDNKKSYIFAYNYIDNIWNLFAKYSYKYDDKNREVIFLYENPNITNNDTTWIPEIRNSFTYDQPTLYLGFYNKYNTDAFNDGQWIPVFRKTFEDCGSVISKTSDIFKTGFNATFDGDRIFITDSELGNENVIIRLVSLSGKVIFNKHYKELPHYIHTYNLPNGLYMLNIISKNKYGTQKLIKN